MNEANDKGHISLLSDLGDLFTDAERYEFHDVRNNKYALPKVELVNRLNDIATYAKAGKYDNKEGGQESQEGSEESDAT